MIRQRAPRQQRLQFRASHGGRREGAGRPKLPGSGVNHVRREAPPARFPVHITVKLRSGLPRLQQKEDYAALRAAFAAGCQGPKTGKRSTSAEGAGAAFRLVHYAILNDHLHLLAEAEDRDVERAALRAAERQEAHG